MGNGMIQINRTPEIMQFDPFNVNDVIGIYINYNNHKISFYQNHHLVWTSIFPLVTPMYVCASVIEGTEISILNHVKN